MSFVQEYIVEQYKDEDVQELAHKKSNWYFLHVDHRQPSTNNHAYNYQM